MSVTARRVGYRVAYRLLQLVWLFARPAKSGVKCVLTDGDRVLLVRHTYGSRGWALPGGGLKRGEQPVAGARREMLRQNLAWSKPGTGQSALFDPRAAGAPNTSP